MAAAPLLDVASLLLLLPSALSDIDPLPKRSEKRDGGGKGERGGMKRLTGNKGRVGVARNR